MQMPRTSDEVLEQVTAIVDRSRERGTNDGYFAALYRRVTAEVKARIGRGEFEDGPRMERLVVVFANRYLAAVAAHEAGDPGSESWEVALQANRAWWPVVVQHLLLGMNAHINFDLGAAVAEVAPGERLPALRGDFERMNDVLAALVDDVEDRLARVWPPLRRLDGFGGGVDEAVVSFSMRRARDCAWSLATDLAGQPDADLRRARLRDADRLAAMLGRLIRRPPWTTRALLAWIRLRERGSVAAKLAVLGS